MNDEQQGSIETFVVERDVVNNQPTETTNNVKKEKMMRSFPGKGKTLKKNMTTTLISVVVVLLGVFSGWLLSSGRKVTSGVDRSKMQTEDITKTETEAGTDESNFSDSAEGELVEGGIQGEGTHHLERAGGPSQNVYLTSTLVDLQSFVGKNVQVWGETLSAVNAGWLMDVGKIKVIN